MKLLTLKHNGNFEDHKEVDKAIRGESNATSQRAKKAEKRKNADDVGKLAGGANGAKKAKPLEG